MIQLFEYPHDTLMQTSTAWTKDDSIVGYDDIERFETEGGKFPMVNFSAMRD